MRFRLPENLELSLLSTVAWGLTSVVGRSLRLTVENDAEVKRRIAAGEGQILITWHGRNVIPLLHLRNKGIVIIISPSRDGEIQYRTFQRFGCDAVRGSTGRNASKVTIAALRKLREGRTLALAPDGPKGPACVVQPGTLYLALKSGCPVIPAGVSAHPALSLKSWDAFLVPRLFARAAIVFGKPIYVPENADADWLQNGAVDLQGTVNSLQDRADRIVGRSLGREP